jgi:solute:Na+ symporter, SSS family
MPVFNTVNTVDLVLIGLYFVILIWVGIYSARQNKNTDEYFKGGGKIPWLIAGLSNWVSGFSAFMFVAAAGFTYVNGGSAVVIFTSAAWAYLLGYFTFAKKWRRARLDSPLQFLSRRFSTSTTYYYSFTAIIPQIIGIGQGLYILCIFVSTALGFSERQFALAGVGLTGLQASVIIVGTVMVVYTVIGGLWAAVLSDAVQSVIIGTMTVIIFPISFMYLGQGGGIMAGFSRLLDEAPKGYFGLNGEASSPLFLISYLINVILGYNVAWALAQRYLSVPDERGAQKMALLCAGLSIVGPMLWLLPMMASRVIFPNINELWPSLAVPAEASFVSLALMLLPHGMIGFVVSAILSATLGQANDAFNWLAATLTKDVYVPMRNRFSSVVPGEREQLMFARSTMLIVGILGIAVAMYIPRLGGAFNFALQYYSLTAAFMMPVALGMVYTRTPWWSGIASCTAAIGVGLTLMALGVWSDQAFARNILSESCAASVVFFGSALWFRESDPRHAGIFALERDFATPAADEKGPVDRRTLKVYRLLGLVCLLLGGVLTICILVPATHVAPALINPIGGALLIMLGGFLMYVSRNA